MPKVTARQIWITVVMTLVAAPAALPAGSAAFRPAWFADRALGIPISAWILLLMVLAYLALLRIISAAVFTDRNAGDEGGES
jgi:hypothetical protein